MREQDILSAIYEIIVDHTDVCVDELKPELDLIQELDFDSLIIANMVYDVEKKFGIQIPDDEMWQISKIQDLVQCISNKL